MKKDKKIYRVLLSTFVLLVMLSVTPMQAQSSLFFEYNPACVTKLDYEQEGKFHDIAFTDYVFNRGVNRVVFRVKKIAINQMTLNELPKNVYNCSSTSPITAAMIQGINEFKAVAYIVVPNKGKYDIFEVNSVATAQRTGNQIIYKSEDFDFTYMLGTSLNGLNLNGKASSDKNVFYDKSDSLNCLPRQQFKVVYKSSSALPYQFTWLQGIGFERIFTREGAMQLKTINNQDLGDYVVGRCGADKRIPAAVNTAISPYADTAQSLNDLVANSKVKTPTIDPSKAVNPYSDANPYATDKKTTTQTNAIPQTTTTPTYGNNTNGLVGTSNPYGNGELTGRGGNSSAISSLDSYQPAAPTVQKVFPEAVNGIYVVKENDNLYEISEAFKVPITRLMEINGLQNYTIDRGQPLMVVDNGAVPHQERNPIIQTNLTTKQQLTVHVVEQGDNLYQISKQYGLTLVQLFQLNDLKSNDINIDQQLIVGVKNLP